MTTAAKFPTTVLTLAQAFGEMPNFPELVLSGIHNASTTSIIVTTAIPAGWPQVGWITIDSELMRVTSWAVSTFTVAARDGSAANSQSTTAASHADTSKVGMYLTALQWNQIVAEVIAIETQILGLGQATSMWQWNFVPGMTIQSTLVGTGSYGVTAGYADGLLQTGGTSASSSGLKQAFTFGVAAAGVNKLRYWTFPIYINQVDGATDYRHFITEGDVTTQPSLTVRHVGIRATTASTVLFSTADGATEQTTDISAFVTAAAEHHIAITFDGTTARCYINGTLRATHSTNVPTANAAGYGVFAAFLLNSAAANKQVHFGSSVVQMAA